MGRNEMATLTSQIYDDHHHIEAMRFGQLHNEVDTHLRPSNVWEWDRDCKGNLTDEH